MSWSQGDMDRRLQGVVRFGRVTAVDAGTARARVTLGGETETAWLPWLAERAATIKTWAPVAVGEQVVVLSSGGETSQGVIVGSVFSGANAAPSSDGGAHVLQLGDASITVTDGEIAISAGGATVTINGTGVSVDSSGLTHNGTNVGDDHVHGGVTPGAASTAGPQ